MTLSMPQNGLNLKKWEKIIAIIKFFIESKVLVRNFRVLSRNLKVHPMIDPIDPHFALFGDKKCLNLPLGCFFQKSAGCVVLSIY